MGLIKAAAGAIGGTMADQWKDFFICDAIEEDVLVVKGSKHASGRSSNTKGESNVITDGSAISVADGQCMMIVEQGRVIELSAEPGIFIYKNDLSPSIFAGNLKDGLKGAAKDAWERFKFGGGPGKDQRIYYFNTKELLGNKYGTINPIPFKVMIDPSINKFLGISVRCNGEYSYKIVNPMLFYTNVCGNVQNEYTREEIDSQLKSELLTALQPALAKISARGIDYSEIPLYTQEITEALNQELTSQWTEKRGLQIVSFGINSISVSDEDKLKIQNMQQAIFMSDPSMAAGNIAAAQADAMRTAAANENGAMTGFMGMGMAAQASGLNANDTLQIANYLGVSPYYLEGWTMKQNKTDTGVQVASFYKDKKWQGSMLIANGNRSTHETIENFINSSSTEPEPMEMPDEVTISENLDYLTGIHIDGSAHFELQAKLLRVFEGLNEVGQNEAIKRIEEMLSVPKYVKGGGGHGNEA